MHLLPVLKEQKHYLPIILPFLHLLWVNNGYKYWVLQTHFIWRQKRFKTQCVDMIPVIGDQKINSYVNLLNVCSHLW